MDIATMDKEYKMYFTKICKYAEMNVCQIFN